MDTTGRRREMDSKTREFCGGRDPNTGRGCRDFPFCDAHSGRLTPDREDALRRQIIENADTNVLCTVCFEYRENGAPCSSGCEEEEQLG
jgi:hypothetical protein